MVVAPAGTTATWLNAGLATSPSGCKRVISMGSTVALSPDRSDPAAQLRRKTPGAAVVQTRLSNSQPVRGSIGARGDRSAEGTYVARGIDSAHSEVVRGTPF